ncbi:MAG: AMP-binding protein [Rubrivivax sp.]
MPTSLYDAFLESLADAPERPFLCVPDGREAAPPGGLEWTYAETARRVDAVREAYRAAGYGAGHRVALLLGNEPEYFVHLLALNALGASAVPVNPDYRPDELAYLLDHSGAALLVARASQLALSNDAVARTAQRTPVIEHAHFFAGPLPAPAAKADAQVPGGADAEAALMYTSGTTARPKACVLANRYFLRIAQWYIDFSDEPASCIRFRRGQERLLNPLPVFHVSAGALSFTAMLLTRGCLIMPGRFSASRWWPEVKQTRATILHYIGLVPAALMALPASPADRDHAVRWGLGAAIDPTLQKDFEARFGFPNVDVWGMTELAWFTCEGHEPRVVGQRAVGRAIRDVEIRIVDDEERDVPPGKPGQLLVRTRGADPRQGFFSCYLGDPQATEAAWRGGWFHTGDILRQAADGRLTFVDRAKNIVRRSGENIAAAEIEAVLQAAPEVEYAAVIAAPDETRQEEVFACIVPRAGHAPGAALAQRLFERCRDRMAYYKAPGWILFMDALPLTNTQKVQKAKIFAAGTDPRAQPGVHDLRALKRQRA